MATDGTTHSTGGLADLIAMYRQLSTISAMVFAPLARTYVGSFDTHVAKPLSSAEVVNLALRKMAFEAGEMFVANNPPVDKDIPVFALDKEGRPPDLTLTYVAAAALAYIKLQDKKADAQQATAPATAPQVIPAPVTLRDLRGNARASQYAMAPAAPIAVRTTGGCGCGGSTSTSSSGGCGCGGSSTTTPPQPAPCYDPCAGGLVPVPPANLQPCACAACQAAPAPSTDCPSFLSISCDTQQKLKACIKVLICDLIAIIERDICALTPAGGTNPLAPLLCNFLHCVREALCPPPAQPCLPLSSPMPCLPCSYAVENS